MYSRSSQAQYSIDLIITLKKNIIPLTVQPMKGTGVRKTTILLSHIKRFRVWTLGKVNSLNYSSVSSN